MTKVWIVIKNGKVDDVFSTEEAAKHHYKALIDKWNLCEIVEKELRVI